MVALFVFLLFVTFIIIDILVTRAKEKEISVFKEKETLADYPVFSKDSILVPKGYYFSKGHTWLNVEKDGKVKLGLDDFLNKLIGKFTISNLRNHGEQVAKGDLLFELKLNGKSLKVKSPIDGIITAVNKEVVDEPELISRNPYELGWIVSIEPKNLKESLSILNIGNEVVKWMKAEVTRFKDFLGTVVHQPQLIGVTMYDGGNINEGIINQLDEKSLDAFQNDFLNLT
ncbi:MAG: hypothetical protein N3A61_05350 [Ignavibacteria bacterium]|nr:hypothetical protein [Ignavibacteria bacterium]